MPRRILYLSYLGGLGGGESSLLSHILALDPTRWTPHVICGTPGAFVDELRAHDLPVTVMPFSLPYFRGGFWPTATPAFALQLARYVREHKIGLIHSNSLEAAYYAAPLTKLLGVPLVWTCWAWWQAERGWKSVFYEYACARIVTPTEYLKQSLVTTNARLDARTIVLPFGVKTDEFAPGARDLALLDEWHVPHSAPTVTLLARFQSVKGHSVLLDAAAQILDAFPETRLLLVGDTAFESQEANETRQEVRERVAADERLRAAVVFCGFRRDIPRVLHATDVLVCPSWFETYGMANLEAMACSVPVVSTNFGGPSETIADGESGFLVPPRDPAALAARIVQLLGDAALRKRIGENARRRVLARYDLRESAARLQDVYEQAVSGARR